MELVSFFLSGIAFATFALSGLLFLKYWRLSRDKFFAQLCGAFWLLAIERVTGVVTHLLNPSEVGQLATRPWLYLIRLVAFIVIFTAVMQKNHSADRRY